MWSRSRYDQEAKSLVTALNSTVVIGAADGSLNVASDFLLANWRLELDRLTGDIFLSHPSVECAAETFQEADDDGSPPPSPYDEDDLSDATILMDMATFPVPGMNDGANTITWHFSVVYSETYQVPVLYFHAQQTISGEPCSRDHILRRLFPGGDPTTSTTMSSDHSWEFVSQEPHPHTGFPSYFLHPCRTSERVKLLRQGDDDNGGSHHKVHYLWAWMSMMLPAFGFSIPPHFYRTVQDSLCGTQPPPICFFRSSPSSA